jgi:Ca2+:H+ antiporter
MYSAASLGGTMLVLSGIAFIVPAIFYSVVGPSGLQAERDLSFEISIVLLITYLLALWFTLRTHRHLYLGDTGPGDDMAEAEGHPGGSVVSSLVLLVLATAGVAVMSEMLVGTVEEAAAAFGMNEVFIGVILVAIVGNAAEHSTAVLMAAKNKMDAAVNIAVGSSIQIALFVAPILVLLSYVIGPRPMDLLFTQLEVVAVALSVAIMAFISHDGESHWMEGVQLLAVYLILGMAFFVLPM